MNDKTRRLLITPTLYIVANQVISDDLDLRPAVRARFLLRQQHPCYPQRKFPYLGNVFAIVLMLVLFMLSTGTITTKDDSVSTKQAFLESAYIDAASREPAGFSSRYGKIEPPGLRPTPSVSPVRAGNSRGSHEVEGDVNSRCLASQNVQLLTAFSQDGALIVVTSAADSELMIISDKGLPTSYNYDDAAHLAAITMHTGAEKAMLKSLHSGGSWSLDGLSAVWDIDGRGRPVARIVSVVNTPSVFHSDAIEALRSRRWGENIRSSVAPHQPDAAWNWISTPPDLEILGWIHAR
jgi:hypothetical protein